MATQFAEEIEPIFLQDNRFSRSLERLKRAYVDARYTEHFVIINDEPEWLANQVNLLNKAVDARCFSHIAELSKNL